MQIHQLKPKKSSKKRKRVGRGGKRGTYSGKGNKGQQSRSGRRLQPSIRELIKRYPKLRGYRFNSKFKNQRSKILTLNLDILEKHFKEGGEVSPRVLLEKKIIRKIKGRVPNIKILGKGEVKKALTISNCSISKAAKEKIEKAGGKL